ncbi:hypothetical protein HS088_TW20G00069 [Tripterygium wilfordii]|uniref:Uncharacterized protein n=1 Tax=Tripterygium wilfordii TaxID=458696 RepID=A0A7J7C6W9_TRIWF|nr:uncharacterized protein LOC119987485 [Tripterygium wilfordii]KAF5729705.1 hypothetical protein HS088_TW20G00069 [Tripterygium wilfordii]
MSLNCLTFQSLQRTNSEQERCNHGKQCKKICCIKVNRSWSGNLSPQPYEQIRSGSKVVAAKKMRNCHRRLTSTGAVMFEGSGAEPRLVRSSGMRRDWSFEDLRQRRAEVKRADERLL